MEKWGLKWFALGKLHYICISRTNKGDEDEGGHLWIDRSVEDISKQERECVSVDGWNWIIEWHTHESAPWYILYTSPLLWKSRLLYAPAVIWGKKGSVQGHEQHSQKLDGWSIQKLIYGMSMQKAIRGDATRLRVSWEGTEVVTVDMFILCYKVAFGLVYEPTFSP